MSFTDKNYSLRESRGEEARKRVEAMAKEDPSMPASLRGEKTGKSSEYVETLKASEKRKREQLEWQKQQSRLKRKKEEQKRKKLERERIGEPLRNIKLQQVQTSDPTGTAYKKALGNIGSVAGAVGKTAVRGAKYLLKKQKKKQSEKGFAKFKQETDSAVGQKRLSPAGPPEETIGQRARRSPEWKKRQIELRGGSVTEEMSCWREEFIYELSSLRKKSKKKKNDEDEIVDVMTGKNKVTIGPEVTENYHLNEMGPLLSAIGRIASTRIGPALASGVERSAAQRTLKGAVSSKVGDITAELIKNKMERRFKNEPEDSSTEIQKVKPEEGAGTAFGKAIGNIFKVKEGYESLDEAKKREKITNAFLAATMAASAAQSPTDFVRTGHIESPGVALMQRWGRVRGEAERNLDSGRVIPKNKKKDKIKEECECETNNKDLMKSLLVKIINMKKRKNSLINNKYIGEAKTPAWQRKEGKNPEGGLNRKGIASYRKQNPGSKLSMAVTTKPSKLKHGSKSWKRRKSFCARMSGMPGPMKDSKGRPTRKALSLKKWNC